MTGNPTKGKITRALNIATMGGGGTDSIARYTDHSFSFYV